MDIFKNYSHAMLTVSDILLNLSFDTLTYKMLNDLPIHVSKGGRWFPSWCVPRHRIAIIIPFADRQEHLKIFLKLMHPFLQNQLVDYTIFVVEQVCFVLTEPAC